MAIKTVKVHLTKGALYEPARASKEVGESIKKAIERILDEAISPLKKIASEKMAEIQQKRFANNGAYNGHEEWAENTPATKKISGIGAGKKPLQQSGHLKNILTDPDTWDESMYAQRGYGGFNIALNPPDEAAHTPYINNERNYVQPNIFDKKAKEQGKYFHVARPYLDVTDEDTDEIADALSEYIFNLLGKEL